MPVPSRPAASEPVAAREFLVAVGLFADGARADLLVQQLTQAGLRAAKRPSRLGNQRVQQVLLGPFATRAAAEAELNRLRLLGGHADANVVPISY